MLCPARVVMETLNIALSVFFTCEADNSILSRYNCQNGTATGSLRAVHPNKRWITQRTVNYVHGGTLLQLDKPLEHLFDSRNKSEKS